MTWMIIYSKKVASGMTLELKRLLDKNVEHICTLKYLITFMP